MPKGRDHQIVSGTTVRIRTDTREALRELERQTGQKPQDLLARAVEQLRRTLVLAETNAAYSRLTPDEADAYADELRAWDATLTDGLE